jgi:hypothetical protein
MSNENKSDGPAKKPDYIKCSGSDPNCSKKGELPIAEHIVIGWKTGTKTAWFPETGRDGTSYATELPENPDDIFIHCPKLEPHQESGGLIENVSKCCEKAGYSVRFRGITPARLLRLYGADKFSGRLGYR